MLKNRSHQQKFLEEDLKFVAAAFQSFDEEFNLLDQNITSRIQEINDCLEKIRRIRGNFVGYMLTDIASIEEKISFFQREVNSGVDEINIFENEIKNVHLEIKACQAKLLINIIIKDLIKQCTDYYFDDTGEYEFKGSTSKYYHQHGFAFLLSLTHLIATDKNIETIESQYLALYHTISSKLDELFLFSQPVTETQIKSWSESHLNSLFDNSFDRIFER
jgi:hypothetical protein